VPISDTVVRVVGPSESAAAADQPPVDYIDREALRALQTPQVFRWGPFVAAHHWCHEQGLDFTDDGGLLAARGAAPVVVMGEPENWKVTTDADLDRAVEIFRSRAQAT
jgi:2-C-methyl-D-erythritol 4-phosphate cytidylyltransferase